MNHDWVTEPMTLGNMRSLGVHRLAVTSFKCHRQAIINMDGCPHHMLVPDFGDRAVCVWCGTAGADLRPNWKEYRPHGTG
jgi:hypothetical protein